MAGPGKPGPAKGTTRKPPNSGGSRLGKPNKSTAKAREAISMLLDGNVHRIQEWLDEVASTDPKAAMNAVISMLEFGVPKLARMEMTGKDGGPLVVSATPEDERL